MNQRWSHRLVEQFQEGGWVMYPIALLGCLLTVLGLVFVVVGLVSKTNRALPLSLVLLFGCVVPPAFAVLGALQATRQIDAAIESASPEDRDLIRMAGQGEVMSLSVWGFSSVAFPSLLGGLLLGIGLSRLERFKPSEPVA